MRAVEKVLQKSLRSSKAAKRYGEERMSGAWWGYTKEWDQSVEIEGQEMVVSLIDRQLYAPDPMQMSIG